MQKLLERPAPLRTAHSMTEPSRGGHTAQVREKPAVDLVVVQDAPAQSLVLMQRPAARVEPFAPGAGCGYVARRPLSLEKRLLPGSSPLLGGFEFWNFRVPPAGVLVALLNRQGNAAWRIRGNSGNGSRYFGLWLLPRCEFREDHEETIPLQRFISLSARIGTNNCGHFAVRFVVQDGNRFYLSRTAADRPGRVVLFGGNLADQTWAAYDPLHDLRANTNPEGWTSQNSILGGAALLRFDTPSAQLRDVQAFGLYAEAVNRSTTGDRCLEWDDLHATIRAK